jgi:periplasmic divalent cation tolerance protein
MNEGEYLIVLVSVSDAKAGVALGRVLVEERLAGCVQVIPGGTAIYRWQGVLYTDPQAQLIIKTTRAAWPALQTRIPELHSDDIPEILALPVAGGLASYLHWMDEVVTA